MAIIAVKAITARKNRKCESLNCKKIMPAGETQVRLYGNAEKGDPKYSMYICLQCATDYTSLATWKIGDRQ